MAHPAPAAAPPDPHPPPRRPPPTRIFFWLLYAFLAGVWVVAMQDPGLRGGPLAVPFTALLILHGFLHSRAERLRGSRRGAAYVAVQGALALALVVMARGGGITDALWFPVAGECFGLFRANWQRALGLAGLVAGTAAGLWLTGRAGLAATFVPAATLALLFVGIYAATYLRQMQERERAEALLAQLGAAHRQLQDYAARVEELTVTQERQRMARELHDTLAQGLAGLIMQLEAIDDLLARGDGQRARTVAGRALERARSALAEARATIQALRSPAETDDLSPAERGDLAEAIRRQLEALQEDTGIHCTFEAGPGDLRLPPPAAAVVLRVVQEGLANVARHARARHVSIRLSSAAGQAQVEVADDGAGFDPAAVRPGHFGLVGLSERVALAGGALEVDSQPGRGTRLRATLPTLPPGEGSAHGR